jgi:hypothetical protein
LRTELQLGRSRGLFETRACEQNCKRGGGSERHGTKCHVHDVGPAHDGSAGDATVFFGGERVGVRRRAQCASQRRPGVRTVARFQRLA